MNFITNYFNNSSFTSSVSSFFTTLKDIFVTVLSVLKRYLCAIVEDYQLINDFETEFHDFVIHDRIKVPSYDSQFLVLDQYIGNIRFCLGEVVFKEMYFLLMLGCIFLIYMIVQKIFQAIKALIYNVSGSGVFKSTFGKFGQLISNFIG